MNPLRLENCARVDKSTLPLTAEEVQMLLQEVPGWEQTDRDSSPSLTKTFKFKNFTQALRFTNEVGQQAEDQDHHPAILTEWGRVSITWWTHVVRGLHRNDFIMAARTDGIYETHFR